MRAGTRREPFHLATHSRSIFTPTCLSPSKFLQKKKNNNNLNKFFWFFSLQLGENRRVLQALRTLLDEFREELREEETRRCQLQQAYASDKAAWEVKWAETTCQVAQVQMAPQRRPLKGQNQAGREKKICVAF